MKYQNEPTVIGIGAMKCATTLLSEYLRYYPEIFMRSPKEIHYFSNYYYKELSWYLKHFKNRHKYKELGEFSITYLLNKEVAKRIKKILV